MSDKSTLLLSPRGCLCLEIMLLWLHREIQSDWLITFSTEINSINIIYKLNYVSKID